METRIARSDCWTDSLDSFIELTRHRPFEWGTHDCCLFAADAVYAMTGIDPAAPLRGEYASMRGAIRVIDVNGGMEVMCDRLAAAVGMRRVPPDHAGRGDIAMVENPLMDALGVIVGRVVACAGQDGLVFMPRSSIIAVWKV